ncbi:hypothetical protein [Streptomyces sp. NPDC015350]|uniref:hypothetical protein n=1 Tax=Streptomyces sp. NPDC015350 TaxID=3364955 RepID=UPI003701A3C3
MRDAPRTTNDARRTTQWHTAARVTAVCGLAAFTWLAPPAPAQALGSVRAPDSVRVLDSAPAPVAVRMQPSRALRADEVTKYYVVKSVQGNGGEQETLFGIAERTLGDGDRFEEILVLNSGRQLPDGSAFVSPDQLTPGFPLILPEDADGPGVEFGVLPEESVVPANRPRQSASPTTRAAAGRSAGPFAGLGDRLGSPWLIGVSSAPPY